MNSEGKAARDPSREALQESYTMSAEMRRGSVGAVYGLHHKKKSLLVDRHPRYLSRLSDSIVKRVDKIKSQETKKVRNTLFELDMFYYSLESWKFQNVCRFVFVNSTFSY